MQPSPTIPDERSLAPAAASDPPAVDPAPKPDQDPVQALPASHTVRGTVRAGVRWRFRGCTLGYAAGQVIVVDLLMRDAIVAAGIGVTWQE